jgi:tubulin epsilon
MNSNLGSLFDETQFVMDVSGSGNNFAQGHYSYGPQYREKFEEGSTCVFCFFFSFTE